MRKILSIVFFSIGFFLIIIFIVDVYLDYRLKMTGVVVKGVVVNIESKPTVNGYSDIHTLNCIYDDSTYSFIITLNKVSYNISDSVMIRFNPHNPEGHIQIIDDPDWYNKWLVIVLGICATTFGFWIWHVPRGKLIILSTRLDNFFDSLGLKG